MPDLDGLLGGGGGAYLNSLVAYGQFLTVVTVIVVVGLIGAAWAFVGITRRNIGRKAGLKTDWMPFVPFARTVYLLQVVNEEWWKLFFLEGMWFYPLVISWFFNLFGNSTMSLFGYILAILYALAQVAYKIYFRNKFFKAFNIKGEMSLSTATIWGFYFIRRVFECLIAYTNLFSFGPGHGANNLGEIVRQDPMTFGQRPGSPPAAHGGHGQRPAAPVASGACSLSGMSGMYAGQELPIAPNDDLVIGRDSAYSNIIIDQNADKVSRKHCVVRFDPMRNSYMVTDFSKNGTFIDGGNRLIANAPTAVPRGTIIALGSRENRFRLN